MRLIRSAVLYTALALGANPAFAAPDLVPFLQGDMRKLVLADEPAAPLDAVVIDAADAEVPLSSYRGKYVLLNFWATWCPPCRAEMPALDRLQAELGGERFAVVTIATGRNPVPAIKDFFASASITHLPMLRDPKQTLARQMAVLGLPVTVILDPEGREIARMQGDAHWDGPEAKALIAALIASEG
ncbi:TlpA disulfide reductase family protein [Frigidibacter sp.]|uniref:TlpA disulfide reductase family protein n=1 Tax=Frigidibacter sp. TaxID=2586418 RepID=UPI002736AF9C|nr:TlpA disulfide reductase family protein [Frigidibacter sp.]MDP3341590.1 TlpA disulfide reductase family protein [Frigidibacter sp.]